MTISNFLLYSTAPYDLPEVSVEFEIDRMTGVISPVEDDPSYGTHHLTVIAYNASKVETNVETAYVRMFYFLFYEIVL